MKGVGALYLVSGCFMTVGFDRLTNGNPSTGVWVCLVMVGMVAGVFGIVMENAR